MSDMDTHMWRNVLLAGARGLEYTFKAIASALSGEQPVELSGYSGDHDAEPSQSGVTGRKKKGKKAKEEKEEKKAKRAPSAYNLFVAEQMKLRKAANPEIPNKEHFKAVAADWKTSSQNKKNAPGASEAPARTEDPHLEDFEDEEVEGLLEATSEGGDNEADAEAAGRLAREAEEREKAEKAEEEEKAEKAETTEKEKKDKKKRKKERQADAQENGGTGPHRDEEEGTADKRSSKKGKR